MCTTQSEECFATKLGFRVGISITFGILVTAIICNVQVSTKYKLGTQKNINQFTTDDHGVEAHTEQKYNSAKYTSPQGSDDANDAIW